MEEEEEMEEGDSYIQIPKGAPVEAIRGGGLNRPPVGKRGPPILYRRPCAPVVGVGWGVGGGGGLWRLPTSQQWVAPGQGSRE